MEIAHAIILLATGIFTGFFSGLLGVGGGSIMTPVQYIVYTDMGISTDMAIKLAFGTNLLVTLPTTISGAWRHHRKGAVHWKPAIIMGGCTFIAAFAGATLATHLPGAGLKMAFGALILAIGIMMLTTKLPETEQAPKDNPWLWVGWAIPLGLVTGTLGVGGGLFAIPILVLALRFQMHNAIATSLAIMIFTCIGGVIGFIVNGLGVPNLPAYSIGYVHLPTWFLLVVTSIGLAQVGAVTTHRLPARQLQYIFVALVFYMGLKLIGVFDWLGWPL